MKILSKGHNPFREQRPFNFSIIRNNVNAVHYNLKNYRVNKSSYTILESSGWRKFDSTPSNINSALFLSAMQTCNLIRLRPLNI